MSARFTKLFLYLRHHPVAFTCFVLTLVLAVVNHSLWQERTAVTLRDQEARQNGEFMLQALNHRSRITSDLSLLHEAMAQIEDNLLEEQSMEVNLGYFYRFERATRVHLVRLNQLSALPAPADARFRTVPFSMQVSGAYRNQMSFLRALESGPRILRVRNCTFERASDNSGNLIMDLTVEVLAKT